MSLFDNDIAPVVSRSRYMSMFAVQGKGKINVLLEERWTVVISGNSLSG